MTILIIVGIIVLLGIIFASMYNSLVRLRNNRENAFADIDVQLKQRHDLIPQLVDTVKGYAAHEKETFDAVVSARAKATQTTVSIDDLTPEKMAAYQRAQGEIGSALSRLLAVTENYPELKANENFQTLQAQLEGTENRIAVARKDFNDAVNAFNTGVRKFPKNILASLFGFESKAYLKAKEHLEDSPEVSF